MGPAGRIRKVDRLAGGGQMLAMTLSALAALPAVLPFPDISPEIFSIDIGAFQFALRWYALAYIAGILGGMGLAILAVRRRGVWPDATPPVTAKQIEDIITWVTLAIVIGGRLGYVLFYQPDYYLEHPLEILAIWQGGMSFHGGMVGTGLTVIAWALRHGVPFRQLLDLAALAAPLGLLFGRLANFINAELWGKPSTMPWAVIFPGNAAQSCANVGEFCARHPSQLYEGLLEGVVLLVVLWAVALRGGLKAPGLVCGLFLAGYAVARIFVELFRQADPQYVTIDNPAGHVIGGGEFGLTMGQVLSLPMLAIGVGAAVLAVRAARRTRRPGRA